MSIPYPHIKLSRCKNHPTDREGNELWNWRLLDPRNAYKVIAGFNGQLFAKAQEQARTKALEVYQQWKGN